ncbi:hypothetical protein [Chitinimonas koreensis]|uniref:hypothetical protein n=1 Tax=Chitinimonas koreensis TaxID=356302 RepID=UPI001653F66B|nr:hypothetical protein [Chitinimonas koreensis]QNM95184.1 hypothetical protein H9L41_15005 [Chitinimonas koreensis]
MFEIISALGTWALNNPRPSPDVAGYGRWVVIDENMGRQRQAVHGELTTIGLELEALAWTLGRYAAAGEVKWLLIFINIGTVQF